MSRTERKLYNEKDEWIGMEITETMPLSEAKGKYPHLFPAAPTEAPAQESPKCSCITPHPPHTFGGRPVQYCPGIAPKWKKCGICGRENSVETWKRLGKCPNCGSLVKEVEPVVAPKAELPKCPKCGEQNMWADAEKGKGRFIECLECDFIIHIDPFFPVAAPQPEIAGIYESKHTPRKVDDARVQEVLNRTAEIAEPEPDDPEHPMVGPEDGEPCCEHCAKNPGNQWVLRSERDALRDDLKTANEAWKEDLKQWGEEQQAAEAELSKMREALKEISKGRGAFSLDHLTHASNTIENMKSIALAALSPGAAQPQIQE